MEKHPAPLSSDTARDISIRALTFLTSDPSMLSRFLDISGWTPEIFTAPGSRAAILAASLDYLMSEEDLLLTFAANCDVDPGDVALAHRAIQSGTGPTEKTGR